MTSKDRKDYNNRLFNTNWIRKKYHSARFEWAGEIFVRKNLSTEHILELGCFDGRLLSYIPSPAEYVGIDGDWEGGLSAARRKFAGRADRIFIESVSPTSLKSFQADYFDTFASLETMEHIPPELIDAYLAEIARVVNGDILITVPNEKGPVLLLKQAAKKIIKSHGEPYSLGELLNATLGRMSHIRRDQHKGFDYSLLIQQIQRHFNVMSVTGLPFTALPPLLNLTIAIHARTKK